MQKNCMKKTLSLQTRQMIAVTPKKTIPHDTQFMSVFGYLQIKCSNDNVGYCKGLSDHKVLESCEEQLRYATNEEWFRHKLLRSSQ